MSDELRNGTAIGTAHAAGGAVPKAPSGRPSDGGYECYDQVQAWARLKDRAAIESYPLYEAFTAALEGARLCTEDQLMCYRGRCIPFCMPPPNASNMGPPCPGSIGTDRYNYDCQVVLYLCRCIYGVAKEVCPRPWERVWVQSYTFDLKHLCIADFRPPVEDLLNHVFYYSETAAKKCGTGFLFSKFVAGRVADVFDGMIVPGVKPGSGPYANVVVFRPHRRWRDWLTDGCYPQRLADLTPFLSLRRPAC